MAEHHWWVRCEVEEFKGRREGLTVMLASRKTRRSFARLSAVGCVFPLVDEGVGDGILGGDLSVPLGR